MFVLAATDIVYGPELQVNECVLPWPPVPSRDFVKPAGLVSRARYRNTLTLSVCVCMCVSVCVCVCLCVCVCVLSLLVSGICCSGYANNWLREFLVLYRRSITNTVSPCALFCHPDVLPQHLLRDQSRDPMVTRSRLVSSIIPAVLMGLIFFQLKDNDLGVQGKVGAALSPPHPRVNVCVCVCVPLRA